MKKNFHRVRFFLRSALLSFGFTVASCAGPMPGEHDRLIGTTAPPPVNQTFKAGHEPGVSDTPRLETPEEGPIQLTVTDAVIMALSNNRSLDVERLTPSIRATFEDQEAAVFDPVLEGSLSTEKIEERLPPGQSGVSRTRKDDFHRGGISMRKFFPTGTELEAGVRGDKSDFERVSNRFDSETRFGVTVTQAILRGYGSSVNLARLRQARLETAISAYELRGFGEHLVAEVEQAYWDYALAIRRMEIVEESLRLAEHQLDETREMINVGAMAEAELAAVQAEVATQKQGIINAKSAKEKGRLRLLRLINPPGQGHWGREVVPIHPPELPEGTLEDIEDHVAVAMIMRPEINQARLNFERGEIELVRTGNGLLPLMDIFVTLGKSGYADSFSRSAREITGRGYDMGVGVAMQYPLYNREAGARHQRAGLQLEQTRRAMDNLTQLVETDVRKAHIEVSRTREQIAASTATREFQEEKLRSETEKFRVGRSTNFIVAQAQRDLLISRINEVEAVVDYLKALVDFYRLEGSLLERRGIEAHGSRQAWNR